MSSGADGAVWVSRPASLQVPSEDAGSNSTYSSGLSSGPDVKKVQLEAGTGGNAVSSAVSRWNAVGSKVRMGLKATNNFSTLRDRYSINEVQPEQLKTERVIGEGAYATVEKAIYTRETGSLAETVAVKRLKPDVLSNPAELEAFLTECSLTRKLKHKYVVGYIGVGSMDSTSDATSKATLFLVQEFMGGGTLKQAVSRQMLEGWVCMYSNKQALQWCIQVASALAYLHTANPVVIHRDLKMENILLSADKKVAKLADFGLCAFSRRMTSPGARTTRTRYTATDVCKSPKDQDSAYSRLLLERMRTSSKLGSKRHWINPFEPQQLKVVNQLSTRTGTLMYMAPEMFLGASYTEKVDVFSFGVIMYELFHRYLTMCAISIAGTEEEVEAYAERVSNGYRSWAGHINNCKSPTLHVLCRPPLNDEAWPEEMKSLIRDCWAQDPAQRPTMSQVLDRLQALAAVGLPEPRVSHMCGCF